MQILKHAFAILLATALVACGGGGGSPGTVTGGSSGTGTTTATTTVIPATTTAVVTTTVAVTPAIVEVLASSNTLPSSTGSVLITALVKNSGNTGLAGQVVTFSASSGALQGGSGITDANGVATINLVTGADRSNRNIVVTAVAAGVSGAVTVPVVGTQLSISGNGSSLLGGVSVYTFRAVGSSGGPISNAVLNVTSSLGNLLSTSTFTTDATGNASTVYTANVAGNDTLKVAGLGATAQLSIAVSNVDFTFQTPGSGTQIPIGATQTIAVRYQISSVGVPNKTVTFSTTRGSVGSANVLTDANGDASTTISSTTSGPAIVNAAISGVAQSGLPVEFVATTPATIVLQANPNAVLPNSGGATSSKASLLATVRDLTGNPVKNVIVNFTSVADPSGGTITPGTASTDSNGSAQVNFVPGAVSSASNGVVIRAAVSTNTSVSSTASITVSGQALFLTIGTGNSIDNLNVSTYKKPFTVYVTDSNGAAVVGQPVVLSVLPLTFAKGQLAWNGTNYAITGTYTVCANEDKNTNGILDPGEDTNGSGSLTPGGVVLVSPGSVTTDANGFAIFELDYGEQFVPWVSVRLKASATVAGTESSNAVSYFLEGLSTDFTIQAVPPAGVISPFHQSTSCTNDL
jgi:hypothetical protein